jgi:hypothetical protein
VGSSGKTRCSSPGTCDPGSQYRVATLQLCVLLPGKPPSPRPLAEPHLPGPMDSPIELPQTAVVRGSSIVLVMAADFRIEGGLLPFHGVVAMGLAPFSDSFQRPPQALFHRLDMNREVPSPATRALVRASRPVELHHQPLSELSVTLSRHSAPIRQTYRSCQVASARRDPHSAAIPFAGSG